MTHSEQTVCVSSINFEIQSSLQHIAVVMDGNRRWAHARHLPAVRGHQAGVKQAQTLVRQLSRQRIECLTLFGFSAANWRRERVEIEALFGLAAQGLNQIGQTCERHGVRFQMIGRRDRLPDKLMQQIEGVELATATGTRHLRLALDYSARQAIFDAVQHNSAKPMDPPGTLSEFGALIQGPGVPPVDLLIRTGNAHRLSDFMLWECAFAELYFSPLMWPDFDARALDQALTWYHQQQRNFGV